jgi:hypothetical protein
MTDPVPARVRVTRPPGTPSRPSTVAHEIDHQSEVGAVYMRSLMRAQLRLAIAIGAVLVLGIGVIPAALRLAPSITAYRVLAVPIPWLVLGAGVYPVIIGLAVFYVRRAERNERIFAAMVGPPDEMQGNRSPTDGPPANIGSGEVEPGAGR